MVAGGGPLSPGEFWSLCRAIGDPSLLLGTSVEDIADKVSIPLGQAERYAALLGAGAAFASERARLEAEGVRLISALDEDFPERLRHRLHDAWPSFLLVVGPLEFLDLAAIGVVGSRDASAEALEVAASTSKLAAASGMAVVSGLARGIDQAAMAAALDAGVPVVGVPAEGIRVAARSPEIRRRTNDGELCIASPYAPTMRFTAGTAMGRNKIVYALAEVTLVVCSDSGSGGTWEGAREAMRRSFGRVAVWTGVGAGTGNTNLVELGGVAVSDVGELITVEAVEAAPAPLKPPRCSTDGRQQHRLVKPRLFDSATQALTVLCRWSLIREERMSKLMNIRRADACVECGAALDEGARAYWDSSARVVRCVACGSSDDALRPSPDVALVSGKPEVPCPAVLVADTETRVADCREDIAGGSAKKEYERRSARELARKEQRIADDTEWRRSIKEQRPVLGRIAAALTPVPQVGPESQPTTAWKVGTEGEVRVAEVLTGVSGIDVLHDRLVPGSRANIDHIVVGSAGVFVIDAKKYTGAIEVRNVGGLFRPDERLYVNNRDRSKLIDGVLGQVDVVRTALAEDFGDVPIRGVLCFIGCEWGWIMKQKHVKGVTALWPNALPDHVSVAGDHATRVAVIAAHLRGRLRPGS